MDHQPDPKILGEGRYLRLICRSGWEFVERTQKVRSAFIGAVTDDGKMIVTEEYREPVGCRVIGCPAGLIGDGSDSGETIQAGVVRELQEEVGYTASRVTVLTQGPTSAGQCDEVIACVLAEGLTRIGEGGGVGNERGRLTFQEVPLAQVDAWLREREVAGSLVDPKVYTLLYFIRLRYSDQFK